MAYVAFRRIRAIAFNVACNAAEIKAQSGSGRRLVVVLGHHVDIVDVDAASSDVSGHEGAKLAVTKVLQ